MFAFGYVGEKSVHLRVGVLEWREAVTCDRLLKLEIELLQLNVLQALRNVIRAPEHLNECSQSARTEDEFADVEKHQPNLQTAGIKQLLQSTLGLLRVLSFRHHFRQGGPIKPRAT